MITYTDYLLFNTEARQEFVRITDEVAAVVKKSGVKEGMVLVSAMHITSGVYVNDWEDGLIEDFQVWLEKLAPAGLPYRHHQTGEDNADAHLKRTIMGHQVMVPITNGKLDLGPWEQIFYAEFDGQRKKRVVREGDGGVASDRRVSRVGRVVGVGAVVSVAPRRPRPVWRSGSGGSGADQAAVRAAGGGVEPAGRRGRSRRDAPWRGRPGSGGGDRADGRGRRGDRGVRSHHARRSSSACSITSC